MEFSDLIQRAMSVRAQYAQLERKRYGAVWTSEELALGFVGDVGDLQAAFLQTMDELTAYLREG